jgi:DNA invertase Pin-like site-specific DNA recombinase
MKAAIYTRVSTLDQNPTTQLLDLQQLASQRGFTVVKTYVDHGISGTKSRRPGLDEMLHDARRHQFDVVLVWAADRLARSVKHFVDILAELDHLKIGFISYREQIDTGGPLGKAIMTIVAAIAELERSLIVERVKAGLRRARLEGRRLGRKPLDLDKNAIIGDRARGLSFRRIAKLHQISTATVRRVLRAHQPGIPENAGETGGQLETRP